MKGKKNKHFVRLIHGEIGSTCGHYWHAEWIKTRISGLLIHAFELKLWRLQVLSTVVSLLGPHFQWKRSQVRSQLVIRTIFLFFFSDSMALITSSRGYYMHAC